MHNSQQSIFLTCFQNGIYCNVYMIHLLKNTSCYSKREFDKENFCSYRTLNTNTTSKANLSICCVFLCFILHTQSDPPLHVQTYSQPIEAQMTHCLKCYISVDKIINKHSTHLLSMPSTENGRVYGPQWLVKDLSLLTSLSAYAGTLKALLLR